MKENNKKQTKVCFNKHCFEVEIAETLTERTRGLMYRENLDENKGMLFVFDKQGKHSFWMKNTLIPLDIIWIDENKEVVFIQRKVQPCADEEECLSVKPDREAKYVLEINAGIADETGIKLADKAVFNIIENN